MSYRSKTIEYQECRPSRVEKYRGIFKPRCNGGTGCNRCWEKYNSIEGKFNRWFKNEIESGIGLTCESDLGVVKAVACEAFKFGRRVK